MSLPKQTPPLKQVPSLKPPPQFCENRLQLWHRLQPCELHIRKQTPPQKKRPQKRLNFWNKLPPCKSHLRKQTPPLKQLHLPKLIPPPEMETQLLGNTLSITFRHLPPNSARSGYTTEGALFISVQLSVVSALWKAWVLIRLRKQHSSVLIQMILVLFVLA